MKPYNIQIEYLTNPIGIDVTSPRVTWQDENLEKQSAFRIDYVVNGVQKSTGKIYSDHMNYIFNEAFDSRDCIEIELTVFDENDNSSEKATAFFEMGLLHKTDWKGNWISGNYKVDPKKRYPVDYFKKKFSASNIKKARLYASACGLYEVSINEQKVSDWVFAPGSTDYGKRIQYQSYDVAHYLQSGDNEITFMLADGWYRGSIGAKGRRNTFGNQSKLIAQLEITDFNDNVTTIVTDDSFLWSNDGPLIFADLKDGEIVDFNKAPSYENKALVVNFEGNLTASNNVLVKEQERFNPCEVKQLDTNKMVFRFQQNLAGYISFKAIAHKNEMVHIRLGEILDENGEVTLKNVQCIEKGKPTPLQEIHVTCKEGENDYKSRFFFGGFQYAQVETEAKINPEDFYSIAVYSDVQMTSEFECSHPLINTLYQNTLWSLKGNSIDIPTDCPTRERMGWTGDSQVFFNTAAYLTDYAAFSKKHLRDVFDRQQKDGRLPQIAPYSNEDWFMWVMNGSVGWADVGVLMPYRFYKRYGDIRILKDYLPQIKKYAHFMINRCGKWGGVYASYIPMKKEYKKYLVNKGQSYGEWAEPSDVKSFVWYDFAQPHPEESTAYTSWILSIVCEICQICGDDSEIELFKEYSEGCKKAYQQLIQLPKYSIDTDRQAKLVRPLYMHLLENEEYGKKRLIEALDHYDWKLGTGFLSTPFILDVLNSIDSKYAYKLLLNEKMPGWLYMAINNTGTIWEGWEGPHAQQGISSLNHYSKGAVVEWLFRGMAGIDIRRENEFVIQPIISSKLQYCKARYKSIYGIVASSWKIEDKKVYFEVEIPANTIATMILPDHSMQSLKAGKHQIMFGEIDDE